MITEPRGYAAGVICPSCQGENEDAAEVCFHCRAVLAAVTRGTVVGGRYEVVSPIGRGGIGEVYRARDRVLEEEVALKLLRAEATASEEWARRFRSEIRLARRVTHPNVCRIHDYGEDGRLRWISMELVAGENLKESVARRGPLPAPEALGVTAQAAAGLEAIHAAGVVHRDLKTLNLMLDRSGRVRVMDFGIAKPAGEETADGASGYVLGSPEYMSPEQARGRPADPRSDLYALGVVLYELVTGDVPFRAETPVATLLLHVEKEPPLDDPRLPPALRRVLARCLAKDPAARFASAGELRAALEAARGGGDGAPRGRRRLVALAVAGGLAVAAAVATLWVSPGGRAPGPSAPARETVPGARTGAGNPRGASSPGPSQAPSEPLPPATPTPGMSALSRARPAAETPSTTSPPATPVAPSSTPAAPPPVAQATPPPPVPATPAPTPAPVAGSLLVLVRPWADVSIDGVPVGQTPLARLPLEPGSYAVLLTHPDYQPYPRRVTIREGETFRLEVDLPTEGVRRPR